MKAIIININKKVEVFDRGNGQYFCPEKHCIYGDSELAVCPEQSGLGTGWMQPSRWSNG